MDSDPMAQHGETQDHPSMGNLESIKWQHQLLQHPLAEEVRVELAIDGESPILLDALNQLTALASGDRPVLIAGHSGVGKKKFAHFFHRMSAGGFCNFHIFSCKELASSPIHLSRRLLDIGANRLNTIGFDHAELLDAPALCECEELFFSSQRCQWRIRLVFIVGLPSVSRFFKRISHRMRNVLENNMVIVPSLRDRLSDLRGHILRYLSALNRKNNGSKCITRQALKRLIGCPYAENFHTLFSLLEILYHRSGTAIDCDAVLLKSALCRAVAKETLPELGNGFCLEKFLSQLRRHIIDKGMTQADGDLLSAAELLGMDAFALEESLRAEKK